MAFPDRIERTVKLPHPPGKVWAALTTAEGLSSWFGHKAEIDLRPGGAGRMTWDSGYRVEMRAERVEEPTVFGFTWQIRSCRRTIRAVPTSSSRLSPSARAPG